MSSKKYSKKEAVLSQPAAAGTSFQGFLRDPASQINALNTHIPAIIRLYSEDAKAATKMAQQLIETLREKRLIDLADEQALIMGEGGADTGAKGTTSEESKRFVMTRLMVMLENMVELTEEVDAFDYLSKLMLDIYQHVNEKVAAEEALKTLTKSRSHMLGRLMVKAMKDQGELQLHFKNLSEQFLDLALVSLIGLNEAIEGDQKEDLKSKTLYSILQDFPIFNDLKDINTTIINLEQAQDDMDDEEDEEEKKDHEEKLSPFQKSIIDSVKQEYEKAFMNFLTSISSKQNGLVKKILFELPKKTIFNFERPLVLSDFLTFYLDQEGDVELQVLALRAIFILLEKHGLDYPNYYKKLYQMIKPQIVIKKDQGVEIQTVFNMAEKSRFLRLLDLSLRSPVLPTQLVAAFLKRLARAAVCYGACFTAQDLMFVISLTVNIIKRHPKCMRLIHRRSAKMDLSVSLQADPYKEDAEDPMSSRALKSSLWELDTLMRQHFDANVRQYAKVFKTDFLRKTAFYKWEELAQVDPLDMLLQELDEIDNEKEGDALKKNLMMKHGQMVFASTEKVKGKRSQEEMDDAQFNEMMDRANAPNKRQKFAEEFEDINDMFALKQ